MLNPGPVTLTDTVRQAMAGPDLCHREPAFSKLMSNVRESLVQVYSENATDYTAALLTGSGTSAVEAMVDSLVPKDRPALVCSNGVYGERIAQMLQMHGKTPLHLPGKWTCDLDLSLIDATLASVSDISYVIAVHHETTTGRLNDLEALAKVCIAHKKPMLVDAVSSFGGTALPLQEWNIAACAATANKCLHGVPGIAFVLLQQELLHNHESYATSLYLDLVTNHDAQENGYPAFTPAIQSLYALRQSLEELSEQGGWEARHHRYMELSSRLVHFISELGCNPLLQDGSSSILTSFELPTGISFDELYDRLREQNFVIYAGQKQLLDRIFRISVMGDLTDRDVEQFQASIASILS